MDSGCRKCGAAPVPDPEGAGWGDGGSVCPSCRADRNARARASATRILAHASAAIIETRPGWRLATVRSLPGMAVLRSVPYGADDALASTLDEAWRELGDGMYLVTVGTRRGVEHLGVVVEGGAVVEQEPLTADEAAALPSVLEGLEAAPAEVVVGGAVDVQVAVGDGDGAGAVAG